MTKRHLAPSFPFAKHRSDDGGHNVIEIQVNALIVRGTAVLVFEKDHRPLIGQEELIARCGYPTSRLYLRAFKDSELLPSPSASYVAQSLVRKASLPDAAFRLVV